MKQRQLYTFFFILFLSVTTSCLIAQCCTAPDSLKVTSVTDSSFCLQWKAGIDSLHCDTTTSRKFQIEHKVLGTTDWTSVTKTYFVGTTFTYCDTAASCTRYKWRIRKICNDTLKSDWVDGSVFKTLCDSVGLVKNRLAPASQNIHSLLISPNPAKDKIVITGNYTGTLQINIASMNGKKVFEKNLIVAQGKLSLPIDISSFDKGIYFVIISDGITSTKLNFLKE